MRPSENWAFKPKTCERCGVAYRPRSGAQRTCGTCVKRCVTCGRPSPGRGTRARCFGCYCAERRRLQAERHARLGALTCCDCGGKRNSEKAKRCASCAAKVKHKLGKCGGGWRRYSYGGRRYRSTWEARFAEMCDRAGLPFEYERRDQVTGTKPDFYFPAFDRYIELHPDCWGPKVMPPNGILLKDMTHARAFVAGMSFRLHRRIPEALYLRAEIERRKAGP